LDITGLQKVTDSDFFYLKGPADALLKQGPVALKIFINSRAHRSEACEAYADWIHHFKGKDYR
jgi:hypothetical protein